jgi:hypothetical protein
LIAVALAVTTPSRRGRPILYILTALLLLSWLLTDGEFYHAYAGNRWQAAGNFLQANLRSGDLVICQQYQQPWRDVDIAPEDECVRSLKYRQKTALAGVVEVTTAHEVVYTVLPQANAGLVQQQGRVWLVVWDRVELPASLPGVRFGRSAVLLADRHPAYAGNLAGALQQAGGPAYIYSLMIAPLSAASGDAAGAQAALEAAARTQPDHPEAAVKLARTEQLVAALAQPTPQYRLTANFNGRIRLAGYTLEVASLQPGAVLGLTLFWEPLQPMEEDYTIFIHLRDQAGRTVAQFDQQPFYGSYPTRHWQPGQHLVDRHQLQLPAALPPGPYRLLFGLYRPETGERLPLAGDQLGENALLLGELAVE